MEENQRMKELNEKGLCLNCGEKPQNPAVPGEMCISCFTDSPFSCNHKGCPNKPVGEIRQMRLCEPHMIDAIHGMYETWEKKSYELAEDKRDFDNRALSAGYDPRSLDSMPADPTPLQNKLMDEWDHLRHQALEVDRIAHDIRKAMELVDEAFPDNFNLGV